MDLLLQAPPGGASGHLPAIALATLLGLVTIQGCDSNPILVGPTVANADTLTGGSVTVVVMEGDAPAAREYVVSLVAPDGSRRNQATQTENEAGSQVVFSGLTLAGKYQVGLQQQASTLPSMTDINLRAQAPSATVVLQAADAFLQLQPAPFQDASYAWGGRDYHYTLSYVNGGDLNLDLKLEADPASLPPGWTAHFSRPHIKSGESVELRIHTADGTELPARVRLLGKSGAMTYEAIVALDKNWGITLTRDIHSQSPLEDFWPNETWGPREITATFIYTLQAYGLPGGVPVIIDTEPGLSLDDAWGGFHYSGWADWTEPYPVTDGLSQYTGFYVARAPDEVQGQNIWNVDMRFTTHLRVGAKSYDFEDTIHWSGNQSTGPGFFSNTF